MAKNENRFQKNKIIFKAIKCGLNEICGPCWFYNKGLKVTRDDKICNYEGDIPCNSSERKDHKNIYWVTK